MASLQSRFTYTLTKSWKEKKTLCIVVPVYNQGPSESEIASFKQCLSVLSRYDIFIVGPATLDFTIYENIVAASPKLINLSIIPFDKRYFSSIEGYNKLMLSIDFYSKFVEYEYLLIYQLDAWIFVDKLLEWCKKGYDYVGSPWINWEWSEFHSRHLTFIRRVLYRLGFKKFNLVGNGGFSLRNVSSFIRNLNRFKTAAKNFKNNEDYFFSFYITSFNPFFSIPSVKEALQFGFDENPEKCFELSENNLPMGCHAWPKNFAFWMKHIHVQTYSHEL